MRYHLRPTAVFNIRSMDCSDAESGTSGKAGGLKDLNRSKRLEELRRSGTLTYAGKSRPSPNKSALVSAFISVSKYGAVKLFESPGRAGDLPM
jgi:hypothetical protein